jgi:hypothetical protein
MRDRLLLAALGVALAAAASGQTPGDLDLELGYRWIDVSGNEQMYRSQINERPGVLIRSLSYASSAPFEGLFDHLRVDAWDVGAGPAGTLRLSADQTDRYRLSFSWRRTDLYSALPAFANPFLEQGIVPGQHTFKRVRDIYDVNLEILPGKMITPILGYTRNVYRGPGRTTYFLGQDEFALGEDLHSRDEEYRIGLAFQKGPVQGAVIQGWRRYRWEDAVSLVPGAEGGNDPGSVLGQLVTASGIARTTTNRANTPITSAWVTAAVASRVKLIGSYVRADANAATDSAETDAGSFVSFQLQRFFSGLEDPVSSKAKTDYWRGSARAEVNLAPNVDFTAGWTERSRSLEGSALFSSLYLDTVTFGGVSAGDLLRALHAQSRLDRTDRIFDATVNARMLGPFAVNAGWSRMEQRVESTPDLSEIVLPDGQGGNFSRHVDTYGAGVTFSKYGLTLGADYRRDDANRPILRTDFVNRDRYKFRAGWSFKDRVRVGATWQETHWNNDVSEIGLHTTLREIAGDVEVSPVPMLTLRASAGEFKADRDILIRVPQNFDIAPSVHAELGHTWEAGVALALSPVALDAGYLRMTNTGSIPFTINRMRARAEVAVRPGIGVVGEWTRDQYSERAAFDQAASLANFNANRYGLFLRWHP